MTYIMEYFNGQKQIILGLISYQVFKFYRLVMSNLTFNKVYFYATLFCILILIFCCNPDCH